MITKGNPVVLCRELHSSPGEIRLKEAKRQPSLSCKAALAISGLGCALGLGAALAYQAHSKDVSLMAGLHPFAGNCSRSFEAVDRLFYAHNQQQLLGEIFDQCPDHKTSAAARMHAGDTKDRAYQELFMDAVAHDQHQTALEYVEQIGKTSLKDKLLKKFSNAPVDIRKKAFDQMSVGVRERVYEQWVRALIDEGKEKEGVELLENKILSPDGRQAMQQEVLYRVRDMDLRAYLAGNLSNGKDKDRAYRVVIENYVNAHRCADALTFGRKVNFDGAGEFGDKLDALVHSSKIDQIRRSAAWNKELARAIYSQHERLDQVAECQEGAFSSVAAEAKASMAPVIGRDILLGAEVGLEIARQLSKGRNKRK